MAVENLDPSNTNRNVKLCSFFGIVWQFLRRLNVELPL